MKKKVSSLVKNVSKLRVEETGKAAEEPFAWWGPSPDDARKAMVAKPKGLHDKRTNLKSAVRKYL